MLLGFRRRDKMPELPEVEVCRLGVLPGVAGRCIVGVTVREPRLRCPVPARLGAMLTGCRVEDVRRRGKYLLFACRGDGQRGWLLVHLGMTGNLRFVAPGAVPGRHDHVDIAFADRVLRYSDPRRFGVVDWIDGDNPDAHPLLAVLGIEPLTPDFTGAWLHQALRRRSGPVKTVLMDAHLLVGVGNIYASESLFRAGISPLRGANRIGAARCDALAEAIRTTLTAAIAAGGSSIRDYLHSDGGAGYFQIQCAVYDRAGEPCRRCGGRVRSIRQGGRSTYYCAGCQH